MIIRQFVRPGWLLTIVLGMLSLVPLAHADCSDGEITATFLVSGIDDGVATQIDVVDVALLGPVTDPTEGEMIAAIQAVQPGVYVLAGAAGPFRLFWNQPMDFGGCAIVDSRNGRVVFAGTVIWAGNGQVTLPTVDSHPWSSSGADPAPMPAAISFLPSGYWWDGYGTPEDVTDLALGLMRATDLMHSFGACDDYTVTSFIYTPTVGLLDPQVAMSVVIVSGRCGPPWNGQPVATDPATWSHVRALFH